MRRNRLVGFLVSLAVVGASTVEAATWSHTYIRQLPDSAFAVVEASATGKPSRHLPHHDARGAVDVPHLCSALARLPQVKWQDPANAAIAQQHLREHVAALGGSPCRPASKGVR